jgi:hypothetical protein
MVAEDCAFGHIDFLCCIGESSDSHAATKSHYKIVPYTEANREEVLNKYADEGWELAGIDIKFGGFILEHE